MSRFVAFCAVVACAGCEPPVAGPSPSAASSATGSAPAASAKPGPSAEPAPPGPAEKADRAAREKAALSLLEGKFDPLGYPEVMTDPGDPFDRGLRGRLTTRELKAPTIKVVDKKITGKLGEDDLVRVVRTRYGQFRICYEARLLEDSKIKGKIAVKIVVSPEGTVSSVAPAGGDIKDSELKSCVIKALQQVSFPKPEGGAAVVAEVGIAFEPP